MAIPLVVLALLAAAGAILHRRRVRDYIGDRDALSDDMIRRIEQQGSIEVDDPIDLDQVRLEEERFWSETWDVPEED